MGTEQSITVRRPKFSFPQNLDPMLLPGQPEASYSLVALSLMLPYVEPYLIRTMGKARRLIRDADLLKSISLFNGQEAQHSRQHLRFNLAMRASCPAVRQLEEEIARDYRRFTETRSLEWNLAYAEGFEAFTSALACFLLEDQTMRDAHPVTRDFFEWHIIEELEHRCVAFDVYEHLCGSYPYRVAVGMYAQWHLLRFVTRAARALMQHDRERGLDHGGRARSWSRLRSFLSRAGAYLVPEVVRSYSPRYTPHRLETPAGVETVLQRLAASAVA